MAKKAVRQTFGDAAPVARATFTVDAPRVCYFVDPQGNFVREAWGFPDTVNAGTHVLPIDCTWDPPSGIVRPGYIELYDRATRTWAFIEDHRGQTVYSITDCTNVQTVSYLGPIAPGWTLIEPSRDAKKFGYHIFIGDSWQLAVDKRDELIQKLKDLYDASTDNKILNGFSYAGKSIKLTSETQRNIQAQWSIRTLVTYPTRIRTVDGTYITITTAEEYNTFFLTGLGYIDTLVQTGWAFKDGLAAKPIAELFAIFTLLNE